MRASGVPAARPRRPRGASQAKKRANQKCADDDDRIVAHRFCLGSTTCKAALAQDSACPRHRAELAVIFRPHIFAVAVEQAVKHESRCARQRSFADRCYLFPP
jgi:coenzyme F420-reducing hydrogenase gamma subunit